MSIKQIIEKICLIKIEVISATAATVWEITEPRYSAIDQTPRSGKQWK